MKTRLKLCPPFWLCSKDTLFFFQIVALANSKKNRNIKANDVNLISMARSIDFCFKTMFLGMFLCFRSIVRCFQCFVRGLSPVGKYFPMTLPRANYCLLTIPPHRNFQWSSMGGYTAVDIFWNHTSSFIMFFILNFLEIINQLLFDCYPIHVVLIIVFIYWTCWG